MSRARIASPGAGADKSGNSGRTTWRRRRVLAAAVAAALGLGVVGSDPAHATLVTPPGLAAGQKFRFIYVTNRTTNAFSSSTATYDGVATLDATDKGNQTFNGTGVTWQALLSTADTAGAPGSGTSAAERITTQAPFFRLGGTRVADSKTQLFSSSLSAPVGVFAADQAVWTGTDPDGSAHDTSPMGVQPAGSKARYGNASSANAFWLSQGQNANQTDLPIYAFSNELTAVPEPASAALLTAAAASALLSRRPRRRPSRPTLTA